MTLNTFLSTTFEQTPVTKFWSGVVAETATQVFKEGCTAPPDTLVQFTHHCGRQTQRLNQLNVFVKLMPEHLYYRPWFSNWVTRDSKALCTHKIENGKRVFTLCEFTGDIQMGEIVAQMEKAIIDRVKQFEQSVRFVDEISTRYGLKPSDISDFLTAIRYATKLTKLDETFFLDSDNRNTYFT